MKKDATVTERWLARISYKNTEPGACQVKNCTSVTGFAQYCYPLSTYLCQIHRDEFSRQICEEKVCDDV